MRNRSKLAGLLAMSIMAGCASMPEGGTGREGQSKNRPAGLKVSEPAPMFKLASLDGKRTVDLASYGGDKPVLLFFGSYT